jgi:hypothetical protein
MSGPLSPEGLSAGDALTTLAIAAVALMIYFLAVVIASSRRQQFNERYISAAISDETRR